MYLAQAWVQVETKAMAHSITIVGCVGFVSFKEHSILSFHNSWQRYGKVFAQLNPLMLCLDNKISFQILDLDEIYCLDGIEFEIMEFVQIPIKSLY